MRSKTSKKLKSKKTPAKAKASAKSIYSESELAQLAGNLAKTLAPGDVVLLEGPIGVGKSTFARYLIQALGVDLDQQSGSPTFAIIHEYNVKRDSRFFEILHMDLYRLGSERELEDAGVIAALWERPKAIVIVEWMDRFPELQKSVMRKNRGKVILLKLGFIESGSGEEIPELDPELFRTIISQ